MPAEHLCLSRRVPVVTLLFCLAALAQAQPSKFEKAQADTAKPGTVIEVPTSDPVPIAAMTLEELPARAPVVTYRHGQLTIDSTNSTLASILDAIQAQTGADITIPDDSSERVAVHLSGPPSLVIPQLIDGSKFGYVIRSSPEDPEGVVGLVLNRKPGSGAQPTAQTLAPSIRADIRSDRTPAVAEVPQSSAQPASNNLQAIAEMEMDKSLDKSAPGTEKSDDPPVAVAQAGSAVSIDDPHPPPPLQLTALQQTPDQAQQQQVTNRQFMQDLYTSRQKLQSQQTQPQQTQ
jgi:hypothetical protein